MKKITLSKWMMMGFLPVDKAAEKYIVGQNLSKEQANEIIHIIARSVDFYIDFPLARRNLHVIGSPYRDFVTSMLLLLHSGKTNSKWADTILSVMDTDLRDACKTVMLEKMMSN